METSSNIVRCRTSARRIAADTYSRDADQARKQIDTYDVHQSGPFTCRDRGSIKCIIKALEGCGKMFRVTPARSCKIRHDTLPNTRTSDAFDHFVESRQIEGIDDLSLGK